MSRKNKASRILREAQAVLKNSQSRGLPSIWGATPSALNALSLGPWQALDALKYGAATKTEWETLAERVNVFVYLLNKYFQDEALLERLRDAESSLNAIKQRAIINNKPKLQASKEELQFVTEALEISDEVQKNCLRRELIEAYSQSAKFMNRRPNPNL